MRSISFLEMFGAVVVLSACSRDSPAPPAPSTTTPSISVATVDAAPPARARPTVRDVVDRWNTAHVKHDAKALEALYAPHVQFYGQWLTGRRCAELKKDAFEKSPDFTQSIRDVKLDRPDAGAETSVSFTKTTTEKGKNGDYPAILSVDKSGLITAESDKVTDANIAARAALAGEWCTDNEPATLDSIPNDKVIPPFRVSSRTALSKAQRSKHFGDLQASMPGEWLAIDIIICPTKCLVDGQECGYQLRVANHTNSGHYPSILAAWLYVNAMDGVLSWDDGTGWKSEK